MSTPGTPQSLASSTTIYMGTTLELDVDQSSSTLELIKADGSHVDMWGKTLKYAFAPQQTLVTLYFTPVAGSDAIIASYVSQGTTVHSTQQNGSAVITIQRPASSGVSFEIQLEQGSAGLAAPMSASASAAPTASARMAPAPAAPAPAPSARMAASKPAIDVRPGPTVSSAGIPGLKPPGGMTTGPGARLQHRLVLTTVDPPPDPDVRPPGMAG